MTIIIPEIIAERYREAVEAPDIARWRSLAYLAGFMADNILQSEPDSVIGDDVRTISLLAWQHALDMQPPRDEDDYNRLSGVMVGWFRGMREAHRRAVALEPKEIAA